MSWKDKLLLTYTALVQLCCGVDKNKVLFVSFGGRSYSDNPRAISEALQEIAPEADIVWAFHNPAEKAEVVPQGIRCVDASNLSVFYKEMATAAVCVNNFSLLPVNKSKKQMMIQTWHGDKAFKKILYDSPFAANLNKQMEEKEDYCDYAVAGSEYGRKQYRTAFRYKGEVLMTGTPRNDKLVSGNLKEIQRIREQLGVAPDTNILLYAPTLRREAGAKRVKQEVKSLDISRTLTRLEERDGCKWICLLRAHPAMIGLSGVGEDSRILDASRYEDMADLLLVSDMLITDYSSCAGDFALLRRPIILFQADRQEYLEKDRTFYFDMESSPYYIAENQAQVERFVSEITPQKAKENCEDILRFYGDVESGSASYQIAKIIKDWIEG